MQELKPIDHPQHLNYAIRIQELARENKEFIHQLIMSDEAHFHLNGFVNKQNCRFWGTENPRIIHQRPLHLTRCTVWCRVTSQEVIGPYFFKTEGDGALTVTGVRYRDMTENFLHPVVESRLEMWFQLDGATAHTARATMDILRQLFSKWIISRSPQINWPPHSPDLSGPDYFLWGNLKERVYVNKPRTLDQLKENIQQKFER
jgi:hypothetical protein